MKQPRRLQGGWQLLQQSMALPLISMRTHLLPGSMADMVSEGSLHSNCSASMAAQLPCTEQTPSGHPTCSPTLDYGEGGLARGAARLEHEPSVSTVQQQQQQKQPSEHDSMLRTGNTQSRGFTGTAAPGRPPFTFVGNSCMWGGRASGFGTGQARHHATACGPAKERHTIAVGISGGVDSAVTAMLLKDQGHDVFGVFMRNWDESEERGNDNCTVEADFAQAQSVCQHLGIPLHEVDFVRQYWTQVFSDFIAQCEAGVTPNPDLACNRHIKFGALLKHCKRMGADAVATGHYARIGHCASTGQLQLLRGADALKDQSYFLASIQGQSLADVMFPLGDMTKEHVRRLAVERGIPSALRRSSAGICFIGRRDFGDFISDYTTPVAGRLVDVDTGDYLGPCPNMLAVTLGQGSGISGLSAKMYVAGKDMQQRVVYVALGQDHPALFASSAALQEAHWIAGQPPQALQESRRLECTFKARYRQVPQSCSISSPGSGAEEPAPSRFTRLYAEWPAPSLNVSFQAPARAVTPQQAFVMYDGEVCLGCAAVLYPGRTLAEIDKSVLCPVPLGASTQAPAVRHVSYCTYQL